MIFRTKLLAVFVTSFIAFCFVGQTSATSNQSENRCMPTSSKDFFNTALCMYKRLCPDCDTKVVNARDVSISMYDSTKISEIVFKPRSEVKIDQFTFYGPFSIQVLGGEAADLCANRGTRAQFYKIDLDTTSARNCVRLRDGKFDNFVLPEQIPSIFNSTNIRIVGIRDGKKFGDQTIETAITTKPLSLCSIAIPIGTKIRFPTEFGDEDIQAIPPANLRLKGRAIGDREKLILFSHSKCAGEIKPKANDE